MTPKMENKVVVANQVKLGGQVTYREDIKTPL